MHKGMHEGMHEGMQKGMQEGMLEGMLEGMQEGMQEVFGKKQVYISATKFVNREFGIMETQDGENLGKQLLRWTDGRCQTYNWFKLSRESIYSPW